MRLSTLSTENGMTRRSATTPHSRGFTHFGAFFSTKRSSMTASTSQPAAMLIFSSFMKTPVMPLPSPRLSNRTYTFSSATLTY